MKADLHLHSRFSDRSAEWLFRRFDFPDSYSEPRVLYDTLRQRGMDLVTLTDHNTLDGALEIADLPGVFLSEEVTTYFPEDRCKISVLVWNLTEAQHREIAGLRENIFHLQTYLAKENLAHAVAHPLYSLNQKLNTSHVERLLLLFRCFEGVNGLRDDLLNVTLQHILDHLTPERIAHLADKHGIAPTHPEPWHKIFTAGSDDKSGMFAARAYTETPARTPAEFFAGLLAGRASIHGQGGTPLLLSHSLYKTGYAFAEDKLGQGKGQRRGETPKLLEKMFARFMEGENPTEFSFAEKLDFLAQGILSGKIFEMARPANVSLWRELSRYFSQPEVKTAIARQVADVAEPERRAFLIANLFANQLAFRFFNKFVRQLSGGNMMEGLQALSAIAPLALMLSPYIYVFKSQSPDRRQLWRLSREIAGDVPAALSNTKRGWFTDTLEDVNGVATTIQKMTAAVVAAGHDLTVVTSRSHIDIAGIPLKNFPPIGEFEIPEYELQKLTFPPMLEMCDYIQREGFTEVIISTPGPIGITALLAAKMLHLRTVGIYHTDFPQYVQILTDDNFMESLTWRYMHWFYQQLDLIYVNSEQYRTSWMDRGIDGAKIAILPRGLDTRLFHPSRRDPKFWARRGAQPGEIDPALRRTGVGGKKPRRVRRRARPGAGRGAAGARGHRRRRRVHENDATALARRDFHRLPERRGTRAGVCVGGRVRVSEHVGHVRQRGHRGAGERITRGSIRSEGAAGTGGKRGDRVYYPGAGRGRLDGGGGASGPGRRVARADQRGGAAGRGDPELGHGGREVLGGFGRVILPS